MAKLTEILSRHRSSSDSGNHSSAKEQPQSPSPVVSRNRSVIYVSDLPKSTTDATLQEIFSKFGDIKVIQSRKYQMGKALPYAHIRYSSPAEAQAAISGNSEHPIEIDGKPIRVEHALSLAGTSEPSSYLFLGNIHPATTEPDILDLLAGWGEILEVEIVKDRSPYAFVNLSTERDVTNILENSWEKPLIFRNHVLNVQYGRPSRRGKKPSNILFVAGYGRDVEKDEIKSQLGSIAPVRAVRIPLTATRAPRPFCHVHFKSTEDANKVLEAHKADPISIRDRPLRIAFAVGKNRDS